MATVSTSLLTDHSEIKFKGIALLPNFLVIGAQKSGTTSLHEYLKLHPDIYLPEQKETKFFVNDEIFRQGMEYYESRFFGGWNGEAVVGEIDPDYIYFERGLTRIAENLDVSQLKFVLLLRQPVDRAFSHYLMTYRRGLENLSFEEALEAEADRICQNDINRMHYSYFDRGLYARQVKRLFALVEPSRVHFMLSERLASNPEDEVSRCLEFLGVDPDTQKLNLDQKFHQAVVPRSTGLLQWILADGWHKKIVRAMLPNEKFRLGLRAKLLSWNEKPAQDTRVSPELRLELLRRYTDDILELQDLTKLNLEHWLHGDTGRSS